MRRTQLIILGCICFLAGLGFARLDIDISFWIVGIFLAASLIFYKVAKRIFVVSLLLGCLCGGLYRGNLHKQKLDAYQQFYYEKIVIAGTATTDGSYSETKQLAFGLKDLRVIEPVQTDLFGEIGVEGFGASAVLRGDTLQVEGKLYPTRGGKQGTIRFARLSVLQRQSSLLENIRHRFTAGVYTALPEPMASFALGLLVGQRSNLPKNIGDAFMATGLTHIVAVSGYNLTVLVRMVQRLRAKKSRYQAALFALSLVGVFVLLVGNSPSIIRASIVSGLSVIAWYYGRTVKPLLLILLTAALTAGINPTYLWSDVGWYLSFLAFFGVLILAPQIVKRITRKGKKPKLIALLIIETFCAQIMTMPIILFIFGRGSLLGMCANMLVVPFVPIAMLLSLVAGIAGMIVPHLSGLCALPAKWLLKYMLDVAIRFAQIPNIMFERTISLTYMLLLYVAIVTIAVILWLKNRDKNGIIQQTNEEF